MKTLSFRLLLTCLIVAFWLGTDLRGISTQAAIQPLPTQEQKAVSEETFRQFVYPKSEVFALDIPFRPDTAVYWQQYTTPDSLQKVKDWFAVTRQLGLPGMNGYGQNTIGERKLVYSVSNYPMLDELRAKKHYEGLTKSLKVGTILTLKEKQRTADVWVWTGRVTEPTGEVYLLNIALTRGARESVTHIALTLIPTATTAGIESPTRSSIEQ